MIDESLKKYAHTEKRNFKPLLQKHKSVNATCYRIYELRNDFKKILARVLIPRTVVCMNEVETQILKTHRT